MKRKPNFKQTINAYYLIAFFYFIAYSPLVAQKTLAKFIAFLSWHLIKSRRKIALRNIEICFTKLNKSEQIKLAKRTFYTNVLGYFQTASAWCRPTSTFKNSVTFTNLDILNQAIEAKEGVLLVGGHFTILDLAGSLLSNVTKYHTVHRHHNNPILNQFMIKSRSKFTQSCIDRKNVKSMIRTLKQNQVMWYAPDQDYGRKDSIFVPFFNTQTATITATSRLAKISNAQVLFTSYFEVSHGKYEIRFFKPENFPSANDEQDALIYNKWLQSEIEQFPPQYLWLHKRFKTRPAGEKTLY
ncbi:lysophospholipid acyltransferase family protein [Marinicellulosiphila megalodicopiae]|uniref:lysophospholipid acyltransferase family protein n=1 Tax=Marinicellulosiphila megalodicopiae TaxID=2724896 RepID=UPI003BAF1025